MVYSDKPAFLCMWYWASGYRAPKYITSKKKENKKGTLSQTPKVGRVKIARNIMSHIYTKITPT